MKKRVVVLILAVFLIVPSFASAGSAKITLVAVSGDGDGILSNLEVEVVPGRGRILLTAEPLIGVNTQNSERVAAEIASKITKTSLEDKDVIFTIHSGATIVDGPSAGAAMTVATISAITGNAFRNDTMLTGTIEEDGTIGQVGGILKKAKAVTDAGARQFLIPKGQRVQTEYVKKTESPEPGVYIETLRPVSIDVVDYAKSKWDMNVREIGSINDVISIMFAKDLMGAITELALPEINGTAALELPNQTASKEEEKVKYVAQQEIKRALAAVSESNSIEGRKLLVDGQELFGKGYFYSAANSAFLGAVISKSQNGSLSAAELKRGLEGMLAKARSRLVAENSTDVYYPDESIYSIASAQQRYLWAESALGSDDGDRNSLAAAGEWLYAFDDMLHDVKPGGQKAISRALIQAKADAKIEAAQKALMNAEAIGGDTTDGARAFGFALLARSQSLPLAQLFNAIDAESYALAASESGPLASLVERAKKLQQDPVVSSGWSTTYMKHSLYLLFMAQMENSRERATDAIFMALRAKGVDGAFADLPQPLLPAIGGGSIANPEDMAGIVVFLAFTIAVWIMWREIRAMRREQRGLMRQLGEMEGQLLIMKSKSSRRRR